MLTRRVKATHLTTETLEVEEVHLEVVPEEELEASEALEEQPPLHQYPEEDEDNNVTDTCSRLM